MNTDNQDPQLHREIGEITATLKEMHGDIRALKELQIPNGKARVEKSENDIRTLFVAACASAVTFAGVIGERIWPFTS